MGCFRVLVAFWVLMVVVPLITAFQVLVALNTTVLNRDFYVSFVENPELFDAIFDEIGVDTSDLQSLVDAELQARGVTADVRMDAALADLIDRDHWRAQAGALADQFFDVLEGRADSLALTVNLRSFGEALRGQNGEIVYAAFVRNLNTCGRGESPFAIAALDEQAFPLPLCLPAGTTPEQFIAQTDFNTYAANFPDRHTLIIRVNDGTTGIENFGATGLPLSSLRSVLNNALLIYGSILFAIWFGSAFIVSPSRRGRFLWLGFTLLSASMFALGVALLLDGNVMPQARMEALNDPALGVAGARIAEALLSTLSNVSLAFWLAGGIPGAAGVLLMIVGLTQPGYSDIGYDDPYDPRRPTVTVGKGKPRRRDRIDDDPWDSPISSS